jgi:L-threonylcarbamoyladenylate synthase
MRAVVGLAQTSSSFSFYSFVSSLPHSFHLIHHLRCPQRIHLPKFNPKLDDHHFNMTTPSNQSSPSSSFDTKVIKVDSSAPREDQASLLQEAVRWIQNGETVAFPTETVYGLGANALDGEAVKRIFLAKGRPSDNPLIVHVSSWEMLRPLVAEDELPSGDSLPLNWSLSKAFWPGALTLLFRKSSLIPDAVTAGQPKIAIRMPSHPIARLLIELAGVPIAAPSANLSGRPSPTTAEHVFVDLKGRIPCIVDGGSTSYGLESTVINVEHNNPNSSEGTTTRPLILRPGGVTLEQLRKHLPSVEVYESTLHGESLKENPPTPGLKYQHYSPNATVILFQEPTPSSSSFSSYSSSDSEEWEVLRDKVVQLVEQCLSKGERVGIVHTHPERIIYPDNLVNNNSVVMYKLGSEGSLETVAQGLFGSLRDLDEQGVNTIVVEGVSEEGIGRAIMNRLRKAATQSF